MNVSNLQPVKQPGCLRDSGFTLIELVIVIAIIAAIFALPITRRATTQYWREESMIRRLSETLVLLHRQAITDGVFYRMEFDLSREHPAYRVGEIVAEQEDFSALQHLSSADAGVGFCTIQLAKFSSPDEGHFQSMIPPRSFPSLADPVPLSADTYFADIMTMRGKIDERTGVTPYILFSPRGFSEFAVIHLQLSRPDNKVTILVNPFTGLTDIYRDSEFKEFEWTYGRKKK
ncbi:MAG: prepilin-type N-terminal cleavage/methylation domain-containing protein [Deltaproteobacteria bacterium]|nr:prepilin-type N-terminal cleavage/methylation domain-containing protein [Deltaproteobacteria bacterium]